MISPNYYDDPVLSTLTCPITLCPIHYPLRDPNSRTIYEAGAILRWIAAKGTSPLTNKPLSQENLQPCPEEQARIENRLKYLKANS